MGVGEIHQNDVGLALVSTIRDQDNKIVDISINSGILFLFRKPTGASASGVGGLFTNGKDGQVVYITQNDDLDVKGKWRMQVIVNMPNGNFHTDISDFTVYENLL